MFAWVCVLCFCQPPFVGWPSHLFHGYICDLLGSDWYGNIIIQARIWSLPSPTLSLFPLSISLISFTTDKISVSRLSHCSNRSLSHIKTANSSPFHLLFNTAFLACLMALYFFLHWVIHLEVQNPTEPQPYLLGGRWSVSHNQSTSAQHRDRQKKNHNVFNSAWKIFMDDVIYDPKLLCRYLCARPWTYSPAMPLYIFVFKPHPVTFSHLMWGWTLWQHSLICFDRPSLLQYMCCIL